MTTIIALFVEDLEKHMPVFPRPRHCVCNAHLDIIELKKAFPEPLACSNPDCGREWLFSKEFRKPMLLNQFLCMACQTPIVVTDDNTELLKCSNGHAEITYFATYDHKNPVAYRRITGSILPWERMEPNLPPFGSESQALNRPFTRV